MNFAFYEIVEDCIEAKNVYDAYLNIKLNNNLINHLAKLGKLIYFQDFDKPYFKIIVRGKYTIKGISNEDKFRILLPDIADFSNLDIIKKHINEFNV